MKFACELRAILPEPARRKAPGPVPDVRRIVFERIELRPPRCRFHFRTDRGSYVQSLAFPDTPEAAFHEADPGALQLLLGHVGLSLLPRLFTLEDFTHVRIEPLALSPAGIEFFAHLLRHGLAELRVRHGIDPRREVVIEAPERPPSSRIVAVEAAEGALLFGGGGKDSAVGAEALRAAGVPFTWLFVNPNDVMRRAAEASGNRASIALRLGGSGLRRDRELTGHWPFNSFLAFAGLTAAWLHRRRWVVASNERSASFPTRVHDGFEVNHQHTKSLDFESRFRAYAEAELPAGASYFSVLRPLYEIQIARLFAGFPAYVSAVVSCNRGLAAGLWCGGCAKCSFVALMLAAFLPRERVAAVFGRDPFESPVVRKWIGALVSKEDRPWECVGTLGECRLALRLACGNGLAREEGWDVPGEEEGEALWREHFGAVDRPHHLPEEIRGALLGFFARAGAAG
jgi:hypothetical protein